jgi:hypothetical protein
MRRCLKSRFLAVLTTACYMAAVTVSAFFHQHAALPGSGDECCGVHVDSFVCGHDSQQSPIKHPSASPACDRHSTATADCPVCQFLSHKPAPISDVPTAHVTALVEKVALASPVCVSRCVFTAWHSRAPPLFA